MIRAGTIVEPGYFPDAKAFGMCIHLNETDEEGVTFIVANPDALTDKDVYVVRVDPQDQFCHILSDAECDKLT